MAIDDGHALIFDGYSGWGPGQLEEELKIGGWLVAETDVSELFGENAEIWERTLRRIGRDIIASITGNVPLPPDPTIN
jgi:putative transcriptional regulator